MKRLRRLLLLFSAFVCCFAVGSASLTASAASSQCYFSPANFSITSCLISVDDCLTWEAPRSYNFTSTENGMGNLNISFISGRYASHWRAGFSPLSGAGNLQIDNGMKLNATFYFQHFAEGNYHTQSINGALYITSPNGTVYEFPVTDQNSSEDEKYYFITVGGTIGVKESFAFQDCTIDLLFSGLSNVGGLNVNFNSFSLSTTPLVSDETAKVVESIDKGFADLQNKIEQGTQDIIDNQNQNTQDIIDNQEQNTQDIIDNENANAGKTHGFLQNIKDGIGNLVNQIVALPGKIWEAIENGLKNLFIPDQEYIAGYKSKWETLLSSRFGAVYQSFEILVDFAESITEADQTNTVSIPRVSIPMPDNNEFVFGPYDVKVVPDATVLNFLVDTCKMITAVVAVFLLVNALRRRWEEIMNAD